MSLSLDINRAKLVIKILYANSRDEVQRFIVTTIQDLEHMKVDRHIIASFIDKIINQLQLINPIAASKQVQNMIVAKDCLNKVKQSIAINSN